MNSFIIRSEGDCERISKVFVAWLKTNSPELKTKQIVTAPNEGWATLFANIYEDDIINNGVSEAAEKNIIKVQFNVSDKNTSKQFDTDQFLSMLNELLDNMSDNFHKETDFEDEEEDEDYA